MSFKCPYPHCSFVSDSGAFFELHIRYCRVVGTLAGSHSQSMCAVQKTHGIDYIRINLIGLSMID
uniref:Uncharacterized protein n=1 Tax=Romanomermis culicivorax TaxID=13658 RepID=A0A915K927_ROMCU